MTAPQVRPDEATLLRLMRAAQTGDNTSYVALLRTCRTWLERYYARKVASHQIDDLVQETLISFHHKRTTFDLSRPFLPWLAAIARYRWVDFLRRERSFAMLDDDMLAMDGEEDAIVARLSLDAMLNALPAKQAQAITLVKIEGLTVEEASLRCGQSATLIRVNVHRGLRRLSAMIESD